MSLDSNPGETSLGGTVTQLTNADGFATFNDLLIDTGGDGYTLRASAPGAVSVESGPFDVETSLGTVSDATGDALLAGGPVTPPPDLVDATITADQGNLNVSVRFAPGTFDPVATVVNLVLDIDENPATGSPGIDSGCVNDAATMGTDFVLNTGGSIYGSDLWLFKYIPTAPPAQSCNTYDGGSIVGTRNVVTGGVDFVIPLSVLGNDLGRLKFKGPVHRESGRTAPECRTSCRTPVSRPVRCRHRSFRSCGDVPVTSMGCEGVAVDLFAGNPSRGILREWIRCRRPECKVGAQMPLSGIARAQSVMRPAQPVAEWHHIAIAGDVVEEHRGRFAAAFFTQLQLRQRLGVGLGFNVRHTHQKADDPQVRKRCASFNWSSASEERPRSSNVVAFTTRAYALERGASADAELVGNAIGVGSAPRGGQHAGGRNEDRRVAAQLPRPLEFRGRSARIAARVMRFGEGDGLGGRACDVLGGVVFGNARSRGSAPPRQNVPGAWRDRPTRSQPARRRVVLLRGHVRRWSALRRCCLRQAKPWQSRDRPSADSGWSRAPCAPRRRPSENRRRTWHRARSCSGRAGCAGKCR